MLTLNLKRVLGPGTLLALGCILLSGQRDLFKYGSAGAYAAYCAGVVVAFAWITRQHQPALRAAVPVFLIAMTAVALWVYPAADGLRTELRGSDQDDAIIICGRALLAGVHPYGMETYLGNPPSPGPGCLLLFMPSLLTGWFPLTTVLTMLWTLAWIRMRHGSAVMGTFCVLLSSSVIYWDLLAVGSDLVAIGLIIAIATDWSSSVATRRNAVALGILTGLLGATRIPLIFIPLLPAFAIWGRRQGLGVCVALVGLATATAFHGAFWAWDPVGYTPLHLLGKGDSILGVWGRLAILLTCTLAGVWLVMNRTRNDIHLWTITLGLGLPLGATAVASLGGFTPSDLGAWEGANYLFPVLPALTLWAALELTRKSEAERSD